MESKKMFFIEMLLLAQCLISFTSGFYMALVINKAIIISLAIIPVLTLIICKFLYKQFCRKLKSNNKVEAESRFSSPITSIDEEGNYIMNPQDLYEAIEKLGYIEHEWEGKL